MVVRNIFLPWYNVYRFLIQNIVRLEIKLGQKFLWDQNFKTKEGALDNHMDNWIIAAN